jgi:hypothetical protein
VLGVVLGSIVDCGYYDLSCFYGGRLGVGFLCRGSTLE